MADHPTRDRFATVDPPTGGGRPTVPDGPPVTETVPDRVGRYEIVGEIARGGMGVVYRAHEPPLSREVAVKLIRGAYRTSPGAVRRFLDEATITGQLQHPGVPPVFEVGQLPDGSPYLAMKLIKGHTLGAILAGGGRQPPVEEKQQGADAPRPPNLLAVFEHVCQAVGYAHAHGVIHRDLKPANVMVGAFGEVQVMDWGLAKVLASGPRQRAGPDADPDATLGTAIRSTRDAGEETQDGSLLGTPAYMPPEQAMGAIDEIDARSDVFGLGAILCVILTGKPPYVADDGEVVRLLAIRAELDDAFARLAASGAEPGLVALCKRCLSPGKADRPADGGAVAAAVAALRAAADDRARRAEVAALAERSRRRVLVGSAAAVAAVLAAGVGVSTWQTVRARDAEGKAKASEATAVEREAAEKKARASAEAVATFMREVFAGEGTQGEAGRNRDAARKRTVMEAMNQAAKTIAGRFGDRPEVEAAVRATIGKTYLELGAYAEAGPQLERALAIREAALGPDHPDTLKSVNNLAALLRAKRDLPAAEALYRRALAGMEAAHGPDHPDTITSVNNLAALLQDKGDLAAAEPLWRRALAGFEKAHGPDHPDTLKSVNNLAALLFAKDDLPAAEPLIRRAIAGREKALGPDHPETLDSVANLAVLLYAKDDLAAAEPLFRRALTGMEKALGPDHPDTLWSVDNLATLLQAKGDLAAAEPLFRRVLDGREKALGPDHPHTLNSVYDLATVYVALNRYADAVPLLERAARGYAKWPQLARAVPGIRSDLGVSLLATGKPADAEPHLLAGYDGLSKQKAPSRKNRNRLRWVAQGLVELYDGTNQPAKAAEWRAKLAARPPEAAALPRPAK